MEIHKCSQCEYFSPWKQNMRRHLDKKHAGKDNPPAGKDNPTAGKDNPTAEKDNPKSENKFKQNQCDKCDKIFTRRSNLVIHLKKCKGKVNKLQCQLCNEIFTLAPAKYRHQKSCKIKHQAKDLIIPTQNVTAIIGNQTNNINSNNNNITNNNNIIVFASEPGSIEFVKTPEFTNKLNSFLEGYNYVDNIKKFNKELMSIKENQCIRKTNLKAPISKVHVGNNKWETKSDIDIYPKIICSLADEMCGTIMKIRRRDRYKILERILDCIADNGYVNDSKEMQKEMLDNFNNIVRDLKLVVYDLSKDDNGS